MTRYPRTRPGKSGDFDAARDCNDRIDDSGLIDSAPCVPEIRKLGSPSGSSAHS